MFTGNGTYFIKYDVQQLDGSFAGFVSQQAGSATSGVTPRFKSYLQLNWQLGPWGATLGNTYQSGYGDVGTDINDEPRRVGSLSLWDLNLTYSGFKNMVLTLGARNLLDTNPPLTNQQTTFQGGYDPTYYDARARFVYGQIAYTFK
jgi:iron complex outermembrane receptor protein